MAKNSVHLHTLLVVLFLLVGHEPLTVEEGIELLTI